MSQKTENWQEALQRVRQGLKENSEPVVEKTEDEVISEEIDGLLNDFEETPVEISEVSDKEIGAMKKLSKDMQAVLKGYQKIMGMGDKELKDRKYNDNYEAILDARNKVLTLIGTLTTKQQLESVDVETEEEVDVEKLSEKNMLGRLAKSMSLNEENKQKLFDYFESGELEQ